MFSFSTSRGSLSRAKSPKNTAKKCMLLYFRSDESGRLPRVEGGEGVRGGAEGGQRGAEGRHHKRGREGRGLDRLWKGGREGKIKEGG